MTETFASELWTTRHEGGHDGMKRVGGKLPVNSK